MEESRTLFEQADRARRLGQQELADAREQLNELSVQVSNLGGAKRKLEGQLQTLHVRSNHVKYTRNTDNSVFFIKG